MQQTLPQHAQLSTLFVKLIETVQSHRCTHHSDMSDNTKQHGSSFLTEVHLHIQKNSTQLCFEAWVSIRCSSLTIITGEKCVINVSFSVNSLFICSKWLPFWWSWQWLWLKQGMRGDEGTWEDKKQDEGTWWEGRGRLPLGRIGREQLERHWRWGPSL